MEEEKRYKANIFDLYGTLVNNFSLKEYKKMLTEMSDVLGIDKTFFIDK